MSNKDPVLLENLHHELKAIREGQQAMAHVPAALKQLQDDMDTVKTDVRVIKLAVKDQTKDHRQLEKRVTKLEHTR